MNAGDHKQKQNSAPIPKEEMENHQQRSDISKVKKMEMRLTN
jgi:hypothetical protein